MEVHVTLRYWLLGAVCMVVLSGAAWTSLRYKELSNQPCIECIGFRGYTEEFGRFAFCARCGGSGTRAAAAELGDELFSKILNARRELFWRVANDPGETAAEALGLAMLVGVGLLVRVTVCRRCRGTGRRMRRPCAVCAGRGRATLADQLVEKTTRLKFPGSVEKVTGLNFRRQRAAARSRAAASAGTGRLKW